MKKMIMVFALITFLACGIYGLYTNYRLGQNMYQAAGMMSVNSRNLAESMEYLENAFQNAENQDTPVNTAAFDSAIICIRASFGYEDVPILEDVRTEYIVRIKTLWNQALDYAVLKNCFTEESLSTETAAMKNQFLFLAEYLEDFRGRYLQMSAWERLFTSWNHEREILSEAVRISE